MDRFDYQERIEDLVCEAKDQLNKEDFEWLMIKLEEISISECDEEEEI